MKDPFWPKIRQILLEMDKIYQIPKRLRKTTDALGQTKVVAEGVDISRLLELRRNIRTRLDYLKAELGEFLTDREVYLVLFPLVVYFDEMVTFHFSPDVHMQWQFLQKELYGIQNGGEVFYETLDDLFRKPDTHPYIYQIYYYILNRGFKGKFVEEPVKIEEYKRLLQSKIPVPRVTPEAVAVREEPVVITSRWVKWYPLIAALILIATYVGLYWMAN